MHRDPVNGQELSVGIDIGGTFTDAVLYDQQKKMLQWVKVPSTPDDPEQGLLDAVRRKGLDSLPWSESARQWCARVQTLARVCPGYWPDVSGPALLDSLEQWLAPFLAGIERWSQLQRLDLLMALQSLLDYPQQQQLEELAPRRLTIPTGQSVALDYTADNGPVLQ